MKYLSPRALIATGIIALSFLFLNYVHGWIGTVWWTLIIFATSFIALRFSPQLDDAVRNRSVITIPFFISIIGFLMLYVLVERDSARWLIMLIATFVVFVVLHTLYRSEVPDEFKVRRLIPVMRMSAYAGIYCLFAASYGIMIFLKLPIWILAVPIGIVGGLVAWSLLQIADIKSTFALSSASVVGLLIFELFWVSSFLPLGYAVQGWLLSGSFYAMVQGIAFAMHNTERLRLRSRNRLIIALVAIVVVAFISRWV